MHPVVRGAAAAGGFGLLTALVPSVPSTDVPRTNAGSPSHSAAPAGAATRAPSMASSTSDGAPRALRCPPDSVPDWNVATGRTACLPLPNSGDALRAARSRRLAEGGAERLRLPTSAAEQRIPRLPNRAVGYEMYRLPAEAIGPVAEASPTTPSGLPLDAPPSSVPWESSAKVGVRIETDDDAPVTVASLDGQEGTARVLLVGELYGVTVATRHEVRSPAGLRSYVVFYGHLDRPGPQVVSGVEVESATVVGYAGDDDGQQTPHVYVEIRQLRHTATPDPRYLSDLASNATSIPTDPRNVLALR